MWLLLSKRFRRFLMLSVAIPVAVRTIRAIRVRVERRSGPTRATGWLGHVEALAQRLDSRTPSRTRRHLG